MKWDAGELGCSQLIFQLRLKVLELAPGGTLEVVVRDPGAPVDLPAWCRATGHTFVSADHPTYFIRRKAD